MDDIQIVADVHEQRSGVPDRLEGLGVRVERASLPAGDYLVADDTIVERKRVLDLHSSITKARFWGQLGRLRAACAFPYVLIEGTDIDRGPLHPHAVRGACLAVIDLGIAVLRSDHQRDSAVWIHRLAVRCQREAPPAQRPSYAQRPKPSAGDPTAEAILSAVPGVSSGTARALLRHFGSVAAVVQAGPDELLEVPGVGRERTRVVSDAFKHQWDGSP